MNNKTDLHQINIINVVHCSVNGIRGQGRQPKKLNRQRKRGHGNKENTFPASKKQ